MITDDDRILSVLRSFFKQIKENFPNHKQKHNVSLNLWHELNPKKLDCFMIDNKQEPWYDSKPSLESLKKQFYYKYLKSMTPFVLSLVISFVGSWFKILRVSWYKCITPFWDKVKLVVKKYLCQCHNSLHDIGYIPNK